MGTQQILMLALVMIVVGIAVSIGITMFHNQAYNSNRDALISELVTYRPAVVRYWKVSKLLGGAGGDIANVTQERVANYIGFTDSLYSTTSDNGEFRITSVAGRIVTIKGLGVETKGGKHPFVTATINIVTGGTTTTIAEAAGW